MTLAQLAVTIALLAGLGLLAYRIRISTIPAFLLAGLVLGPNEPKLFSLVEPSEVTDFVAELGIIFLLVFLGLEFNLERLAKSRRFFAVGGSIDLVVNGVIGTVVGVAAFGLTYPAVILAACIYVSSSAIAVKGLIDLRRLARPETAAILAILLFEDLVMAFMLGFAQSGDGQAADTMVLVAKALAFIVASLAASRWLAKPADRLLGRLPTEIFLLAVFAFLVGMAALAQELGLSEAIGALMGGIVLAETSARKEIETRFVSFRDLFAALFFFVFGLSIDVSAIGDVGWLVAVAAILAIAGKTGGGYLSARLGGFGRGPSIDVGVALIAHGEFTIILAQLASDNDAISVAHRADLVAFAGLYVLATATIGVVLMKESHHVVRRLKPAGPGGGIGAGRA